MIKTLGLCVFAAKLSLSKEFLLSLFIYLFFTKANCCHLVVTFFIPLFSMHSCLPCFCPLSHLSRSMPCLTHSFALLFFLFLLSKFKEAGRLRLLSNWVKLIKILTDLLCVCVCACCCQIGQHCYLCFGCKTCRTQFEASESPVIV